MSSIIQICNQALIALGEAPIASLDDNSKAASTLNTLYDPVRKELLRTHPWNFAITQATLSIFGTTPLFDYNAAYALPSNCLRVWGVVNAFTPWRVVGKLIYSNDSSLGIYYVADITDSTQFDALFEQALVLLLAIRSSFAITQNVSLEPVLQQKFKLKLAEAKLRDSQEDYPQQFISDDWSDSRRF